MLRMTTDMNDIARKTKIETVSMKVITLVTLFFLPGTFISVGRHFSVVSQSYSICTIRATTPGSISVAFTSVPKTYSAFFLLAQRANTARQTLMSTDIFQSSNNSKGQQFIGSSNPYVHLNPWQVYLALSLPLTVVTLLVWLGFHLWEKRRENKKKNTLSQASCMV